MEEETSMTSNPEKDEKEETEDLEEESSDEEEDDESMDNMTPEKRARYAISGRGVTLSMLMKDNIINSGENLLSLEYLGQKFTADLLPNGKIKSIETDQVFSSPSSWAIFCKKLVNPAKKSGCGWASVKYKGKKLDAWKTLWQRQKRPHSPYVTQSISPASASSLTNEDETIDSHSEIHSTTSQAMDVSKMEESDGVTDGVLDLSTKPSETSTPVINGTKSASKTDVCYEGVQEEALNLSLKDTSKIKMIEPNSELNNNSRDRIPVKHASLPKRETNLDSNTLVQCEMFSNMSKLQPFSVSVTTNVLLLMDFHCHLTTSEVVGYLGGKWDPTTQHLSILQAFPCKCRLGDAQCAPVVEDEISQSMKRIGQTLVGWYHSHPYCQPEPSIKDVDCQMSYQLRMKGSGSTYLPSIGIIISPYNQSNNKTESALQMYMVMPPIEPVKSDYGIPMHLKFSKKQNASVSEELLSEMKNLADFYRGSPDWIKFQHSWQPSITFLDKLKTSLSNKLPEDQMENGTFLDFVGHLLLEK
ncbi:hypothetical protein ACJMK2_013652 [Sinanodonta woodiana]|uniref:MPN domain-containing protein n=1 Tax=Sinanodonta woodiana TaxID=1069815 RepID=A0ABD3UZF0_SINWO